MSIDKLNVKRAAGIVIPGLLTALVCFVDPKNTTNMAWASATVWKLLEAMSGNWFSNATIGITEDYIDRPSGSSHYQYSHLAQAIGRAFAKTFAGLPDSFRQSENYKKLLRQGDESELDLALTLLKEIGLEVQAIFADQEKLIIFANDSERQLQHLLASRGKGEATPLGTAQRALKGEIERRLSGHKPEVVNFILRQLDENKIKQLIENFQQELQDPESGTSAWRAWVALQNQQSQAALAYLVENLSKLLEITSETHGDIQYLKEQFKKLWDIIVDEPKPQAPQCHSAPNQIPISFERDLLIGRQSEMEQIKRLLQSDSKLCVIWGMPGIGKSTISHKVAVDIKKHFVDGVLWIEIPNVGNQTLEEQLSPVLNVIADEYGLNLEKFTTLDRRINRVRDLLSHKQVLIVLEDVQDAQLLLQRFLLENRVCTVLVTTTKRPNLNPELIVELKRLAEEDGIALLQKIVGERLKKGNAKRLVDLVEGHTMALQVLGDLLAPVEPTQYEEHLSKQTNLLEYLASEEGSFLAPFELAYSQMSEAQQQLFVRLGLFARGDFSIGALAAISQRTVIEAQLDLVKLSKHTIMTEENDAKNRKKRLKLAAPKTLTKPAKEKLLMRYRMHSLFVDLAKQKAQHQTMDDRNRAYENLAHYYVEMTSHFSDSGFLLLDIEWENLQVVLHSGLIEQQPELALALINNLTVPRLGKLGYLDVRGYWTQALNMLECFRALPGLNVSPEKRAWLDLKAGVFALRTGQRQKGEEYLAESRRLAETLDTNESAALCVAYVDGLFAQSLESSDPAEARRILHQAVTSLARFSSPAIRHERGWLTFRQATALARLGETELAQVGFQKALALLPKEATPAQAGCLNNLANLAQDQGELAAATEHLQKAKATAEQLGDRQLVAGINQNLAEIALDQAGFAAAERFHQAALTEFMLIGDLAHAYISVANLGWSAMMQHKPGETGKHLARASQYLEDAAALAKKYNIDNPEIELHLRLNQAKLAILEQRFDDAREWLGQVRQHPMFEAPGFNEIRSEYDQLESDLEP